MNGTPEEPAPDPGDGDAGTAQGMTAAPKPFSRPVWYPLAAAAAVVALLAGAGMTLLTLTHSPRARPLAADCGLVTCGASLPPAVTGGAAPSTAVRSTAPARRPHRRARGRVLAPTVHTRVPPAASWRPHHRRHRGHAHPPAVRVSYPVDGTDPWYQGFHAYLTWRGTPWYRDRVGP